MRFVRAVWKLLVGIKDALVLLLMLLFFGVLYAGLNAGPKPKCCSSVFRARWRSSAKKR